VKATHSKLGPNRIVGGLGLGTHRSDVTRNSRNDAIERTLGTSSGNCDSVNSAALPPANSNASKSSFATTLDAGSSRLAICSQQKPMASPHSHATDHARQQTIPSSQQRPQKYCPCCSALNATNERFPFHRSEHQGGHPSGAVTGHRE
jgi:hypothetical protein